MENTVVTKEKKEKIQTAIVLAVYLLINIFCIHFHEYWRDEGTAWLIAKHASLSEMWHIIRYEGHPILWYLIVKPFAVMGLPFSWFALISVAIMFVAVLVFLKYPIPFWIKVVVIFSPIFTYVNTVIARPYCLLVLILVLLGYYYQERNERIILWSILVAFSAQIHSYLTGVPIMLICLQFYELIKNKDNVKRRICGLLITIGSMVFYYLQMRGGDGGSFIVETIELFAEVPLFMIEDFFESTFSLIIYSNDCYPRFEVLLAFLWLIGTVLFVTIFVNIVKNWKKCWKTALVIFGYLMFYFIVKCYVYAGGHISHQMMFVSFVFFALWLLYTEGVIVKGRISEYLWVMCAAMYIFMTACLIEYDVNDVFSNGKAMADYLVENYSGCTVVILDEDPCSLCNIISYTEDNINYVQGMNGEKFLYLDRSVDYSCEVTDIQVDGDLLYLTYVEDDSEGIELIYSITTYDTSDEQYYLYKVTN